MSLEGPSSETVDLHTLAKSVEDAPEIVSWLNSILDEGAPGSGAEGTSTAPIDLTALDRRVSSILSSVEIVAEETSSQLERIIDDISRGAPRLAYDLHFMKESAISLQTSLRKLQHASTSAESPETKAALEKLHYLDNVRRGMEAARDVLREAESWSSLESEVSSLLSEQNYEKAAETLSEAAKSMVVFQNTPEYESRRSLMVSLQNQLEASLSSALVAAINSQDVAVCKNYFSIFKNIQREAEFRNYYYGSRRGSLIVTWQKARLREADAEAAQDSVSLQTFAAFLPSFFASFLSLLETERSSIPSIFPIPQRPSPP
jgi:predicted transcriptional regulator